jgi:hypothetical protein
LFLSLPPFPTKDEIVSGKIIKKQASKKRKRVKEKKEMEIVVKYEKVSFLTFISKKKKFILKC